MKDGLYITMCPSCHETSLVLWEFLYLARWSLIQFILQCAQAAMNLFVGSLGIPITWKMVFNTLYIAMCPGCYEPFPWFICWLMAVGDHDVCLLWVCHAMLFIHVHLAVYSRDGWDIDHMATDGTDMLAGDDGWTKLDYLGQSRSVSCLLMPWLLVEPGHHQPWYWWCMAHISLCTLELFPPSLEISD